jgi:queuine tRNA-ribosyltransferase
MEFEIIKKSRKSRARLGKIKTAHGELETPAFVPVASQACVKTLSPEDIKEIGHQAVLCNTFLLHLEPGSFMINELGGLHKFMGFDGVIFTDSGGFQVFSLGKSIEHGVGKIAKIFPGHKKPKTRGRSLVRIRKEGVTFRSPIGGGNTISHRKNQLRFKKDWAPILFLPLMNVLHPWMDLDTPKAPC